MWSPKYHFWVRHFLKCGCKKCGLLRIFWKVLLLFVVGLTEPKVEILPICHFYLQIITMAVKLISYFPTITCFLNTWSIMIDWILRNTSSLGANVIYMYRLIKQNMRIQALKQNMRIQAHTASCKCMHGA